MIANVRRGIVEVAVVIGVSLEQRGKREWTATRSCQRRPLLTPNTRRRRGLPFFLPLVLVTELPARGGDVAPARGADVAVDAARTQHLLEAVHVLGLRPAEGHARHLV